MTVVRRLGLVAPLAAFSLAGCGINSVPTAEEQVNAKWGDLQADYQRRADLIPNLVATVKGYAQQEKSVLVQVTQARADATAVHLSAADLSDPSRREYVRVDASPDSEPILRRLGLHRVATTTPYVFDPRS